MNNMVRFWFTGILAILSVLSFAQSRTTEDLQKSYDARAFFFYNNTLRMLNQSEDPAFDEMIRNVEKMKFLLIRKGANAPDYKKLVSDYKGEKFEMAMSSRHEGSTFDVYLKGEKKTEGMLVLINSATDLMVLDIVGSIALDKVTSLYSTLNSSTDIGSKIREFTGERKKVGDQDAKDDDH